MNVTAEQAKPDHPVIGRLRPWVTPLDFMAADANATVAYDEFETSTVRGLARVTGDRIDLLAIGAKVPGIGDGGRFLDALQSAYEVVCVWQVLNGDLAGMLSRRGFVDHREWIDGRVELGMRWQRAGGAVSDDAAADSPSGLAPAPARFPAATDTRIPEYWSENRTAMREWVIATFLRERLPIEEAYEVGAWHAMKAVDRPLRWFEASLMRDCIRDVLCNREAILRRAP